MKNTMRMLRIYIKKVKKLGSDLMNNNEFYTVRGYQLLEQNKRLITPAMEDYLEMIFRISLQEGYIRINKLSQLLNVRASSSTKMVQKLGNLGLLKYEKYGIIVLSDKGKEIGKFLLKRHHIIEDFLKLLGCEEANILIQTELIEHNLNAKTIQNINILNSFFENNSAIADMFWEYKNKNLED